MDIERVFGVLQSKWNILVTPRRLLKRENMKNSMYCFDILHKMVEEKRPLKMLEGRTCNDIKRSEEMSRCFIRDNKGREKPVRNSIYALTATKNYLHSTSEYLVTRWLMYNLIVAERKKQK